VGGVPSYVVDVPEKCYIKRQRDKGRGASQKRVNALIWAKVCCIRERGGLGSNLNIEGEDVRVNQLSRHTCRILGQKGGSGREEGGHEFKVGGTLDGLLLYRDWKENPEGGRGGGMGEEDGGEICSGTKVSKEGIQRKRL